VLRQGVARYPSSPLLLELLNAEKRLAKERRKLETLPPPVLPETPRQILKIDAEFFEDEGEYPDLARGPQGVKAFLAGAVAGVALSWIARWSGYLSAIWFVWTFLCVHFVGAYFLSGYSEERGLLGFCGVFGFHAGHAANEFLCWVVKGLASLLFVADAGEDPAGALGSWSIIVVLASVIYVQNFLVECRFLPPDYLTSHSFFFPTYPAFNAAMVCSCLEFFLEWRWYPTWKLWAPAITLGLGLMVAGQLLLRSTFRTAERNFWASCRYPPPGEEEDFVGLEIPDRKIVRDGPYSWERHPGYLGLLLWGVGAQMALCNPIMLILVGFVLWASLLHITLEEEKQMYEEFPEGYGSYSAIVGTWIPTFNGFLSQAAFQRDMQAAAEKENDDDSSDLDDESEVEDSAPDEDELEEDAEEEDDGFLPTWDGVPKGGSVWNRQFKAPWKLG